MVLSRDHVGKVFKKEAAMTFLVSFGGACLDWSMLLLPWFGGCCPLIYGSFESSVERMIVHAAYSLRREESL